MLSWHRARSNGCAANVWYLPESIKLLTSNGIVAGSFTAILLHIIYHMIPFKKETEQELMEEPKQSVM